MYSYLVQARHAGDFDYFRLACNDRDQAVSMRSHLLSADGGFDQAHAYKRRGETNVWDIVTV